MANLDTDHGLQAPTMAQIILSFVSAIQANFNPNFAIENANILAQIIVIISQEFSDLYDTLQYGFDQLDPSTATGQNLIDACQYVGVSPAPAEPTAVWLLLNSATAATFPANTQLTSGQFTISNPSEIDISQSACAQANIKVLSATDGDVYTFELDDITIT